MLRWPAKGRIAKMTKKRNSGATGVLYKPTTEKVFSISASEFEKFQIGSQLVAFAMNASQATQAPVKHQSIRKRIAEIQESLETEAHQNLKVSASLLEDLLEALSVEATPLISATDDGLIIAEWRNLSPRRITTLRCDTTGRAKLVSFRAGDSLASLSLSLATVISDDALKKAVQNLING